MKKTFLAYGLGCATLPILAILMSLLAAAWIYFTVPVGSGQGRDGLTAESALVVEAKTEMEAINAEYLWLATRRPTDTSLVQSLHFQGDRVLDSFEMQSPDGETYLLYFDITNAYGNW
jgi:hypothetical protein